MKAILATGLSLSLATSMRLLAPGPSLPAWGQRLGWTLVHSIWQVTLLALVAGLVLACLRRHSARLRYNLAVLCLALMLVAPAITWSMVTIAAPAAVPATNESPVAQSLSMSPTDSRSSASVPQIDTTALSLGPAPTLSEDGRATLRNDEAPASVPEVSQRSPITAAEYGLERVRQVILPWLGQIVAVWLAGVLFCAIRPVAGLWTQWRLQRTGLSAVTAETQRLMSDLARRMNVSPLVRIAESALVQVPMVVGYLRPIILLPASVLVGMTPDQLTSLLAHELAHIRRHDWIINAIQVVVETLMFYHPAVWWLSHHIRCERELCCDDLALAVIGDNVAYGRMLLTLEELRHHTPVPVTALAAAGGDFVQRIRRLLPQAATPERVERGWLGGILALGLLAAFFVGWLTTTRSDAKPQQAVTKETETKTEPLPSQQGQGIVIRGRIVTADQSPLPPDLKLQRRITGSNFAEQVKDVELINGQFTISVDYDAAFVRLYATSKEFAPGSTPRFEVKRGEQVDPVVITMQRGSTARLQLKSRNSAIGNVWNGWVPTSGTAKVTLRNPFEPDLGTFPIDVNGQVTIEHCPAEPVQINLDMPGFEEQQIHRQLDFDKPNDVVVRVTKPARFQVVDAGGQPIVGAKVRLYSRVRANSFMRPRTEWGDGPVWGVSDADGRVELTTLCTIDPVPTNDPGPADYVFRIDAPGQAPYYVGPVRAGSDLGQIQLSKALRVEGEIIRDAVQPERVSVQWRQATLEQGASTGKGNWTTANLVESDGRLLLKLTDLQPGRFDLFVTFSDPNVPENQVGGTIQQLEFHGTLTNSSAGLKIARDAVTPGDAFLTAARASLFPIDEMPPSNLPEHAVRQFDPRVSVAGNGVPTRSGREGGVIVANERSRYRPLLTWAHTAPIQHSMGFVNWHLIILDDGTVIVPPNYPNDIGAYHKLSTGELRLLKSLLNRQAALWGQQVPRQAPAFGNWRHGAESIVYTRDGKSQAFHAWDAADEAIDPAIEVARNEITDELSRISLEARCGGRAALSKYRELANLALLKAFPEATPFDEESWCVAAILSDGSRTIDFANMTENSSVSLVHPIGGQPYVEYVEFHNDRATPELTQLPFLIQADANVLAENSKSDDAQAPKQEPPWSVFGKVVDGEGKPVAGAKVWASAGIGTLFTTGSAETDDQGRYDFHFGPGVTFGIEDPVQLQMATIMVSKPGFFEKNLSRQGNLRMARKAPEASAAPGAERKDDIILPNEPRAVVFVLLPAAHLSGTLIDADAKPLAGYRISLTGDDLPPSSSVVGSTKSDEKGQFKLTEIPTGFKYQILVEPPKAEPPWNAWASGPFDFSMSEGDDFFVQRGQQEVAANRFELQIKGTGINWRAALKTGADHQSLKLTGDSLVSPSRLHASTICLTLEHRESPE